MENYQIEENRLNGGIQKVYKFPNDYGASVIKSPISYGGSKGLWEIAVLLFTGNTSHITYETPVTDDVLGHLDDGEVLETLNRIKDLDKEERS